MKHVFSISAYGESPYLEECIRSLRQQSLPAEILICTSTPSSYLSRVAAQYGIPLFVRKGTPSLRDDWNYCVEVAKKEGAGLLTIAHQDDVYLPEYAKTVQEAADDATSLLFTAAQNIDAMGRPVDGKAEKVKKLLRWPFLLGLGRTAAGRKLALAFGNSIPCPACTYNLNYVNPEREQLFESDYRFVIDWEALRCLSGKGGRFVYLKGPGVQIRLHEGQETVRTMRDGVRQKEELEMFRRFHTEPAARLLMHLYAHSGDIRRIDSW